MSDPAFPLMETRVHMDEGKMKETGIYLIHPGLSKLEWFAGMAMQGILATQTKFIGLYWADVSTDAFKIAEAMLMEAEKRAEPPQTL